jgi:serine/threonine protein kinase/WD40 repeat protein
MTSASTSGPSAQAHTIFQQALERLLPEERSAYLNTACAGNTALRAEVDALLAAHHSRLLAQPDLPAPDLSLAKAIVSEGPGDHIGRYKLLQKIGEGGCGIVFMAEQTEPVQRRVAVKVIRLGMDTEEVVARFEAERQALALMEHPNIAQVLDAGATPTGRPYFVMELVRGVPVTKFCDDNRLGTVQRLQLFIQVCHAVQHAHQKGIIHRDLKPSNILVTLHDGVPVPKVIDFGIAKATAGRLTDKTLFTAFEQFVGTPAYMSPEQAEMSNLDVDTRSDVYSLGVLLYELLTGQPPLDPEKLNSAGVDEIRRQIREVEPARPSTRLATLVGPALTTMASLRGTDGPKFVSGIRGDLDWIVMRCLEKDRRRRYDSASALAEDIERHLKNEPITARPPSRWYALQKLARRHRAVFVTVSAVSVALLLGFGVALRSYFREKAARQIAEEQTRRADTQFALASRAQAMALTALSRTDYLMALDLIERDHAPEAVAHLVRALRAKPDDTAAATLLTSILTLRSWPVQMTPANVVRQPVNLGNAAPQRGGPPGANQRGTRGGGGGRGGGGALMQRVQEESPDKKWVLRSLPSENSARLFDVTTRLPVAEPMRFAGDVISGKFRADGRQLTLTSREYDAAKGQWWQREDLWVLPTHPALVFAVRNPASTVTLAVASPDGRALFTAASDGSVRSWDITTARAIAEPMPHAQPVREILFSPDGAKLVTITQDNAVRVWNAATGQPITPSIADDARPGGGILPGGGGPGSRGGGPPGAFNIRNLTASFSPDGRELLLTNPGRPARVRSATTGQPVAALQRLESTAVSAAAFSPDGKRILTAGATARLWDAATGELLLEFAKDAGPLNSAAFSPDGKRIVTASNNGLAHLWDAATGEAVSDAMQQGEENLWATFSPDGHRVLTVSRGQERAARVWDAATGEPVSALIQVETPLNSASNVGLPARAASFSATFSPDGRWVLTVGTDARIWDAATGLPVSVPLDGSSTAFTPDGKHLLNVGTDGSARLWLFADSIGPAWILDLAEALARCRFDATGSRVFFQGKPAEDFQRLVAQEKDSTAPTVIWARHLLGLTPSVELPATNAPAAP